MSTNLMDRVLPPHIAFGQRLAANKRVTLSHNLSNSCAQSLSVSALCKLANTQIETLLGDQELTYASLMGSQYLRELITDFHQAYNHHETQLTADNVLTFCGAQEALSAIYQAIILPNAKSNRTLKNNEIVVVTPCYPSLVTMAEQMGVTVKTLALTSQNSWQVNHQKLLALVNENTKLIVVNSPHNPSGSVITSAFADEILAVARKFNCYLLADDVSQASNYHNLALSHRYLDYDRAIVISVMSKSFGLAGIRIGWAVTKNEELLANLLAIKTQSSICTSIVDEKLAELALGNYAEIISRNNHIIKCNISLFQQFIDINQQHFSWHPPQAGMLALVKCHTEIPIMEWAEQLAEKSGILIYPAHLFGLEGPYFRLGLGGLNFPKMLGELQQFIDIQ